MNATVKEWIAKAEADFATAGRERRARKNPNYDAICFHAQQGVEKLKFRKAGTPHMSSPFRVNASLSYLALPRGA